MLKKTREYRGTEHLNALNGQRRNPVRADHHLSRAKRQSLLLLLLYSPFTKILPAEQVRQALDDFPGSSLQYVPKAALVEPCDEF